MIVRPCASESETTTAHYHRTTLTVVGVSNCKYSVSYQQGDDAVREAYLLTLVDLRGEYVVSVSRGLSVMSQHCSPVAEQETGGVEVVRDEVVVPVEPIQ